VKYLVLIYSNPQNWGHPTFARTGEFAAMAQDEQDKLHAEFEDLLHEIRASGELIDGQALADPILTKTIRARVGVSAVTDGPYVEAKEQLAGYFVIDCETPERATEIAGRFPDVRFGAVEIRPIMSLSGQEM
jgi:hypothetical protein